MPRLLAPASALLALVLTGCGTAGTTGTAGTDAGAGADSSAATTPAADPAESDAGADAGADSGADSAPGATAAVYDFTAETVDGGSFDGASLQGKPTVLWFWAPWCSSCRAQIDGVSALADDRAGTVNVVGVGGLDEAGAMGDFADDVASSEVTQLSDPDGEVWRRFGVTSQTTYVVLDDAGETVAQGYLADDELAGLVADLVG